MAPRFKIMASFLKTPQTSFFLFPWMMAAMGLAFSPSCVFSQEVSDPQKNAIIEKRIEMIAEANEETEIDYTTLFDELSSIFENPIDLNSAKKDQLEQLILLSDIQIRNLHEHIIKNGKLISIYELQAIEGFDLETIQNILPFIKVEDNFLTPHISVRELIKNSSSQLIIRETRVIEKSAGFQPIDDSLLAAKPNSRYLGSPDRIYARYRFNFGNKISMGFTAEKDEGEEFFKGTQKQGFDFYSAHFYLRNFGKLKYLAIGDYQIAFGQGLTFCTGIGIGKTADVMNLKKNTLPVKPYVSAGESLFMRGLASTVSIKKFDVTGFFSSKKMDASMTQMNDSLNWIDKIIVNSLMENTTFDGSTATSFSSSGYHRTPAEMAKKNNLRETIFGSNIAYKGKSGTIGITAAQLIRDGQINRALSTYNQFSLNTNKNFNAGVDYNYLVRNLNFFGEVARSQNGGIATLNGVLAGLSQDISVSILHRNYQRNYQSVYSNAFAESSTIANEKGLFFGLNARLSPSLAFSGYVDKFEFPWLKYLVNAPSEGVDYLTQLSYKPNKKLEIYGRYRIEIKQSNTRDENTMISYLDNTQKQILRFNSSYKVSPHISLRNRIEFLKYQTGNQQPEFGYLVYQDILYKSMKSPFSCSFRFAMFETDSYFSRIYAYENDVLFAYSIPAYYYRGIRTYIIVQYKILKNIDIWLRVGQTYYSNRDVISSGLSEIQGNTKTEVKGQVRFRF